MNRLFTLAFALATLLVLPLSAAAQDDARTLFSRGQTAYQQGDYDTAISNWTRAYELDARPLIQYNLSQAYQQLGRLTEAAAALDLYLEQADADDANQANARARRSALRERLGRTGVIVQGGPDGATIVVDGQEWGRTPRPDRITLDPGSHSVIVQKEGFTSFRSSIVVPAGQTVTINVEMEAAAGGAGGGDTGGGDTGGGGDDQPPPQQASSGGPGILPWIVVGGGGALLVGGVVVGLVALGAANDAPSSTGSDADSAKTLALVADILAFTGVAAIAGGLLWYFLSKDSGESESADLDLDLYPVIGPDSAGAGATLRF